MALRRHDAITVAEILFGNFFCRFNVPSELHSDQGREDEVFQERCQLMGLQKARTTPIRPQSDGLVERFNQTVLDKLAKFTER